jgi:nucleolar protein 15
MSKKIAAQLAKLQSAEWDSDSESEEVATFEQNADFVQLESAAAAVASAVEKQPAAGKKGKAAKRKAAAAGGAKDVKESNVIYLGRIPHGFYEKEMMGFFKQFGHVRRLRLSRNRRTGNSKHYAFIQFEESEVARIVANTMNDYRLFDHVLSCQIVPPQAIHERMFVGANKVYKPQPLRAIARNQHNAHKSYEQQVKVNKRLVAKENQKRKVLQALGIDYDFPGYAAQVPAKKTHVVFT